MVARDSLQENAFFCTQRPGDLVLVPRNWAHTVVNLAPSVALAFESSELDEMH